MKFDPTMILMLAVLVVLVFFMIRNNRKRKRDAEEMATKFVPGARVMTSFGLYGTLISVDVADNTVQLEIAPKTVIKLHRQAVVRVVDDAAVTAEAEVASAPAKTADEKAPEPEFGQRASATKTTTKTAAKPAAKTAAKPAAKAAAKAATKTTAKPAAKSTKSSSASK